MARALRVEPARVDFDYVGLNHLSWFRGVTVDGQTAPTRCSQGSARRLGAAGDVGDGEPDWTPDAIDVLEAIPNYYLLYYYETDAWVRYQAAHPTRASEVMAIEDALLAQYADPTLDAEASRAVRARRRLLLRGSRRADGRPDSGVTAPAPSMSSTPPTVARSRDCPTTSWSKCRRGVGRRRGDAAAGGPLRPDVDALIRTVKDFELLTVEAAVARRRGRGAPGAGDEPDRSVDVTGTGRVAAPPGAATPDGWGGSDERRGRRRRRRRRRHQDRRRGGRSRRTRTRLVDGRGQQPRVDRHRADGRRDRRDPRRGA